jgi:hypothetical protein
MEWLNLISLHPDLFTKNYLDFRLTLSKEGESGSSTEKKRQE